jgi:hypothetical protein
VNVKRVFLGGNQHKGVRKRREGDGEGKYDQSTLYTCMKIE